MGMNGWVQVGADSTTIDEAEELVRELSSDGLRLTRAQVLRRALALGIETLKKDKSRIAPNGRKRSPT